MLNESIKSFRRKTWITAGCRFAAFHRLMSVAKKSHRTTMWLTTLVLSISILQLSGILNETEFGARLLNAVVVIFTVTLLVMDMYIKSQKYEEQARDHHRCAIEISALHHEIDLLSANQSPSIQSLTSIVEKYNAILSRYDLNQQEIDFLFFQTNHPKDFDLEAKTKKFIILRRKWSAGLAYDIVLVFSIVGFIGVFYFVATKYV